MLAAPEAVTRHRFTLSIGVLPGPNDRLHWAKRARLTKAARETAYAQARSQRSRDEVPLNADTPATVRLTLIRGKGQRFLDADNLAACLKPVLDALVESGWLAGDSPRWLSGYAVEQRRDTTRGPAVDVEIEA